MMQVEVNLSSEPTVAFDIRATCDKRMVEVNCDAGGGGPTLLHLLLTPDQAAALNVALTRFVDMASSERATCAKASLWTMCHSGAMRKYLAPDIRREMARALTDENWEEIT
jgi:hypothetical protein